MSTQFSTIGTGISDVGGRLDEMLKKLGMSMETAPIQPIASNNVPFSLGNNSFISNFLQPTLQPNYNMNLNYNQPTFQSGLLTDQSALGVPPAQSAVNLQNVSESLASLQYSLSNMISMSSNSYPLQNTMLDAGSLNGKTLNTFIPPMGLNNVLGTATLGQNAFYSPQLSPNHSTSNFFGHPQSSPLPDTGFMSTHLDPSLVYGDFDNHLVDGPPGLNDPQNNDLSSNSVPFEFNEAPSHVQIEINSLLDGSNDTLGSSLLMEGLFDQDVAEESVSPFPSQNNTPTKKNESPQSKVGADARSEAFHSNSPSPVSDQPVVTPTPVVAPVVVINPEPEKPSGPKPFSWADITKTTAAPTISVVVPTPTPTATVVTTTSTPSVTNNNTANNNSNNNNSNNNSNNNNNNKKNNNNNKGNNSAANHNANINNPNNKAHHKNNANNNNNINTNNNNNANANNEGDKSKSKLLPVIDNLDLSHINPSNFDCNPSFAKFFVIKSYSEDDIHKSIKYGIWTSTESGNKRLDRGYRECAGKGPVYLFFSVNASGQFCGLAEMTSPLDYSKKASCWNEDKWSGQFTVSWKIIKDIQNVHLRHVKLVNNENKPVTNSRDTQEVFFQPGCEVLQVFHRFQSKNSILDDFSYYNQCEKDQTKGQTSVK